MSRFGRTNESALCLGYYTGRCSVSGRGGPNTSGRRKPGLGPYCKRLDAGVERPVSFARASGQNIAVVI